MMLFESNLLVQTIMRPLVTRKQFKDLEEVTNDLRFDYSEEEVDVWFDNTSDPSYLFVSVDDVDDCEEEE
jgi:hypothetical protein